MAHKSNRRWRVIRNISETGYDILLVRCDGTEVRIEVKTRQRAVTTSKHEKAVHFTLTRNEAEHCDVVVGLVWEHGIYMIIKREQLRPTRRGNVFRKIIRVDENGRIGGKDWSLREAWGKIHQDFKTLKKKVRWPSTK